MRNPSAVYRFWIHFSAISDKGKLCISVGSPWVQIFQKRQLTKSLSFLVLRNIVFPSHFPI